MKIKILWPFILRNIRLVLIFLFLVVETILILYIISLSPQEINNYRNLIGLISSRLIFMLIVLIVCILIFILVRTRFKIVPNIFLVFTILILLVICEVGLLLRLQQPVAHMHFFDEDIYLHKAQRINQNGISTSCAFGIFEKTQLICFSTDDDILNTVRGYPVLLAILFRYFGKSEAVAFYSNVVFGILTIVLTFLVTRSLWSRSAGLFSAIFLAVFPFHINWSVSASPEVPAIFLLLLGLLFYIYFYKYNQYYSLILSFLLIILAAFIRGGELLLLPAFLIVLNKTGKEILDFTRKSWLGTFQLIIVAFFLGANLLSISLAYADYNKLHQNEVFSLEYFMRSLQSIIGFHIGVHDYFTLLVIVGAMIGLYRLAKVSLRMAFILGFSILALFLIYTSFTFARYPQSSRFVMVYMTLLIILTGIGFDTIWEKILHRFKILGSLIILIAMFLYVQTNIEKISVGRDMTLNTEEDAKLRVQSENPSCLFVTPVPAQDLFHGYSAISYSDFEFRFNNNDTKVVNQPCIIFFESLLCKEENKKECNSILTNYRWQKLSTEGVAAWWLK